MARWITMAVLALGLTAGATLAIGGVGPDDDCGTPVDPVALGGPDDDCGTPVDPARVRA